MHIISYVELTPAQEHAIEGFERAEVKHPRVIDYQAGQSESDVMAVFKTFQGQEVMLTIDKMGVIIAVDFTT
jgi:uncharacterized sporulation protein YeaH/YhbH (DUF444 family)